MPRLLAIQCQECKGILYKQDFTSDVGERRFATCQCGNIKVGTQSYEESFVPWYVSVHYANSGPKFFEVDEKIKQ